MVENALYNCNWVEAPPKVQKLILLFMIRCAKATKIEAAPLFIANRNLLGEVCLWGFLSSAINIHSYDNIVCCR